MTEIRDKYALDITETDWVEVSMVFRSEIEERKFTVPRSEVDSFITAHMRLHVNPGINPHNGVETHRIDRIRSAPMLLEGYWWTSPTLKNDENKAHFLRASIHKTTHYQSEEYVNQLDRLYADG